MRRLLPDNCGMDLVTAAEPERYIRSIRDRGQFDVIVIDGIVAELARCKCSHGSRTLSQTRRDDHTR